jgi:hypothetical protein
MVTRVLARKPRTRGSILGRGKTFCSSQNFRIHSQDYVKLVLWASVMGVKRPGSKAHKSSLEVSRLRQSGTISPRPYMPSCCAQGEIYFTFTFTFEDLLFDVPFNSCFSHKSLVLPYSLSCFYSVAS